MGYRGWLGPWVALAGLINEGMEEGEVGTLWGGLWWATGAGWGRASLWPDLLMKGWRRVKLGRSGAALVGCRGWLGPCVALAGLINEGMEEGEPWRVWD